jgi:mono/diheme cytochrome c family protein
MAMLKRSAGIASSILAVAFAVPACLVGQAQNGGAVQKTQGNNTPHHFGGAGGNYKEYDPSVLEAGHKTFSQNCAFCHGANAKGGESGPDLLRSPVVLDDDNGNKIGPVVHNGRPDKGMPKFNLTDEQITQIADFLHDRIRAAAERGGYQILNIVVGDPKAGQAYFSAHCTTCHSVTGDLAHIGAKYDPVAVQQHVVMPREERRRGASTGPETAPVTVTVTLPSGESISGKLNHIDDFVVMLTDANGDVRSFTRTGDTPKVDIHDPLHAHTEMLSHYTDTDIHNLTAYLVTLK